MLSSEYGWDSDQIFGLTLREIFWRMEAINQRKKSRIEIDAALHGVKLKNDSSSSETKSVKLSKLQEENLSKRISARLKR